MIFVDDASTDGSRTVLEGLAKHYDFVCVIANDDNAGPAIRLNQGAERARGKYLALFDCDELLAPDAVSSMLRLAEEHDADMVHGRGRKTDTIIARANIIVKKMSRVLGRLGCIPKRSYSSKIKIDNVSVVPCSVKKLSSGSRSNKLRPSVSIPSKVSIKTVADIFGCFAKRAAKLSSPSRVCVCVFGVIR